MRSLFNIIFLLCLISCNWMEFKNLEPAVIKIATVKVQNPAANPENFHGVQDLWVFLDDVYIGTYPIPMDIPLLESGTERVIRIFPGIREFGIRARTEIYNLMDPFSVQTDLQEGGAYTFTPVFKYKQNIRAEFFEDFENSNQFTNDLDQDKTNHIIRSSSSSQEGNFSGLMVNDAAHPVTEAGTNSFRIPPSAYLELSFRATHDFNLGVNTVNGPNPNKNYFLGLKATATWKKVYIPFREVIGQNTELMYQLLVRTELGPPPVTADTVFLDFIKIISLP